MWIAGVDIGGTSLKIGAVDAQGFLRMHTQIPSVRGNPEETVRGIARAIRGFDVPIRAVGVGTAGRVDGSADAVTASNLDWTCVPLRAMLRDTLRTDVWVDNDAQVALLAEWQHGVCSGLDDVVYLTLGTGIGGALILQGRPYRGHGNIGGEIGHMVTHAGGEPCPCGQRGCYERYASAAALERMLQGRMPVLQLFEAARVGEPSAAALFDAYLCEIAYGLVSLERIFAPQMFVLGGGLSHLGNFLADRLTNILREQLIRVVARRETPIHLAASRNHAGILGGAALARYHLSLMSD